MLDFDFICKRKQPSVAGIIYTFGGQFVSKMYVGLPWIPLRELQLTPL
jgi:ATP citrate (pro-S)-lyase